MTSTINSTQYGLDSDGNVTTERTEVAVVDGHIEMFSRDGARWARHVYGSGGAEMSCDESDVPAEIRGYNSLASIRVEMSSDAGCEWSDAEQAMCCACVVTALEGVYPGVDVECEIADRSDTRVFVYGRERQIGFVTHPEPEDELKGTIQSIVQDVWNNGDFWAALETDESGVVEAL